MAHLLILEARTQFDLVVREANWKYTDYFLPHNLAVQCVWLLQAGERQRHLTDKWFESESVRSQDSTSIEVLNPPPIGETVRARTV